MAAPRTLSQENAQFPACATSRRPGPGFGGTSEKVPPKLEGRQPSSAACKGRLTPESWTVTPKGMPCTELETKLRSALLPTPPPVLFHSRSRDRAVPILPQLHQQALGQATERPWSLCLPRESPALHGGSMGWRVSPHSKGCECGPGQDTGPGARSGLCREGRVTAGGAAGHRGQESRAVRPREFQILVLLLRS